MLLCSFVRERIWKCKQDHHPEIQEITVAWVVNNVCAIFIAADGGRGHDSLAREQYEAWYRNFRTFAFLIFIVYSRYPAPY